MFIEIPPRFRRVLAGLTALLVTLLLGLAPVAAKPAESLQDTYLLKDYKQLWSQSMASELVAGGDVVMRAGVDAVLDQGTTLIAGGDVTLEAERDILMAALVDYAKDKSSSFGLSLSLGSFGVNADLLVPASVLSRISRLHPRSLIVQQQNALFHPLSMRMLQTFHSF